MKRLITVCICFTLLSATSALAISPSDDLLIAAAARNNRWIADLYIVNPGADFKAKQAQIEGRYFELLEDPTIQDQHQGDLQPAMDYEDMASELRRLSREVARLQGSVNPKMA